MWPTGDGMTRTSSARSPWWPMVARHSAASVVALWSTPFGSAVVPEV